MRVAAVFLFALLMMPVMAEVRLRTDDHTLITGCIRLSLGGISFRFPLRVEKRERFYLQIGSFRKIKIQLPPKKRKKSPVQRKRIVKNWQKNVLFVVNLRLGTGNACSTALLCGALRAALSAVPRVVSRIQPQYDGAGYFLQVRCIAVFRLGKLFLTALLIFAGKIAGGRANGNHAKQANQLRHADGP